MIPVEFRIALQLDLVSTNLPTLLTRQISDCGQPVLPNPNPEMAELVTLTEWGFEAR